MKEKIIIFNDNTNNEEVLINDVSLCDNKTDLIQFSTEASLQTDIVDPNLEIDIPEAIFEETVITELNSINEYDNNDLNLKHNYNTRKKLSKKGDSMLLIHSSKTKKRKHRCKECGKIFPFKSHLNRHLDVHSSVKPYSCDYCNKQFLNSYNLDVHLQKHTGNFTFNCDICGKGYPTRNVLERHLNTHTGNQTFQCNYCGKTFAQASNLKLHERTLHLNRPSYTCDICFKIFSYTNSLTAHKKTHLNVKEHVCHVCNATFTRKYSLLRHLRINHSLIMNVK